jgi:hypothetical protein
MRMQLIKGVLIVQLTVAASCMFVERMSAQTVASDRLDEPVVEFVVVDGTVLTALKNLSADHAIAFGFERILKPTFGSPATEETRFSLHLKNVTVRTVLDALCEADHRYTWSAEGSFVNIYPREVEGKRYLLDRVIPRLEIVNVTNVEQGLLAVVKQLPPPEEQIAHAQVGGDSSYPPEPWSVSFANLPVRQAINRLTEHMGPRSCWIFGGSEDFRTFAFFKAGFPHETQ